MKWRPGKFDYLFFFLVFLDLWAMHWYPGLRLLTKPLIVSSLLVWYVAIAAEKQRPIVMVGLIFALLGDIFLMFDAPLFFQMGLGSFLIMQLCYTAVFIKMPAAMTLPKRMGIMAVILIAAFFNFAFRDKFGALQWPVFFYTLAIAAMVATAIRQGSTERLIWGAVLFMVSDLSLAYHKFVGPLPAAGVIVMLTYAVAQYLIVNGFLSPFTKTSDGQ